MNHELLKQIVLWGYLTPVLAVLGLLLLPSLLRGGMRTRFLKHWAENESRRQHLKVKADLIHGISIDRKDHVRVWIQCVTDPETWCILLIPIVGLVLSVCYAWIVVGVYWRFLSKELEDWAVANW